MLLGQTYAEIARHANARDADDRLMIAGAAGLCLRFSSRPSGAPERRERRGKSCRSPIAPFNIQLVRLLEGQRTVTASDQEQAALRKEAADVRYLLLGTVDRWNSMPN